METFYKNELFNRTKNPEVEDIFCEKTHEINLKKRREMFIIIVRIIDDPARDL